MKTKTRPKKLKGRIDPSIHFLAQSFGAFDGHRPRHQMVNAAYSSPKKCPTSHFLCPSLSWGYPSVHMLPTPSVENVATAWTARFEM